MTSRFIKFNRIYNAIFWNPILAVGCLVFITCKHIYVGYISPMSIVFAVIITLWAVLSVYNWRVKGRFVKWVDAQWNIHDDEPNER